jgi:signal transduction histidine kinase
MARRTLGGGTGACQPVTDSAFLAARMAAMHFPMSQSEREARVTPLPQELKVLANVAPSRDQRRAAEILVLALLAILAITWPFATVQLPAIAAFVPSLAAALFVSDCVTAVLLFGQFSILRQWALLIIANGYAFSALMVVAHAMAFPGAFSPGGLFGAGMQSAVWLYWLWHAGLPLAVIGYVLTKKANRAIGHRFTRLAIATSVSAVVVVVIAMFWFVTQHHDILPVTFVDTKPLSLFRRIIGGLVILALGAAGLALLWRQRRSLLDQWLIVALCALLIEVALASVLSGNRYTVSWYAGRFYQLVTATAVMAVLLAETTTLYADVARSNILLQHERLLLERAVQAQRREREARLMTGDAVAASIAHELRQPLTAMVTTADAGLRFLDRPLPNFDKAKTAFQRIVGDGHRAGALIGNIRANFKSDVRERTSFLVNGLVEETLVLAHGDLQKHAILVNAEPDARLPQVTGNRVQLQQVLLNLIMNAIDAMAARDEPRILSIRSGPYEGARVVISVADTGIGIDPHDLDRVFNPLFTTKPDGMGMGLSICRAIIEAHEGRLWFAPNLPRGSVFHFTLPSDSQASIAA